MWGMMQFGNGRLRDVSGTSKEDQPGRPSGNAPSRCSDGNPDCASLPIPAHRLPLPFHGHSKKTQPAKRSKLRNGRLLISMFSNQTIVLSCQFSTARCKVEFALFQNIMWSATRPSGHCVSPGTSNPLSLRKRGIGIQARYARSPKAGSRIRQANPAGLAVQTVPRTKRKYFRTKPARRTFHC